MSLSLDGRPTVEQAVGVIHAALDAGVSLFDTADVYCTSEADIGHNERLLRSALDSYSGGAAARPNSLSRQRAPELSVGRLGPAVQPWSPLRRRPARRPRSSFGHPAADTSSVVIATKGLMTRPDGAWSASSEPDDLFAACDSSLEALGVSTSSSLL